MEVKIKLLQPNVAVPHYAHPGDAAFDLVSSIAVVVPAGKRLSIPTGIALEIPSGYVGLVWDRSGLAKKEGITTLGGVVDSTFRGEISVVLLNTGDHDKTVNAGDRIAQMLIQQVVTAEFNQVEELTTTPRGEKGWGSTGK